MIPGFDMAPSKTGDIPIAAPKCYLMSNLAMAAGSPL